MNEIAVCVENSNKNVSAKETIDAIKNAGFKNVFVQYYNRETNGLTEIEQIEYCKELGLNIIFAHLGYCNKRQIDNIWKEGTEGDKTIEDYIEDFKLLKSYDINLVVIHLLYENKDNLFSEIGIKRLKYLNEKAKEIGIKIAFENTKQKKLFEKVLENIKDENIGICFDSGHWNCAFKDELDLSKYKDRIFAVHLHDNDGTADQHLLPFEGNINWDFYLKQLKENNYNGPVTLELAYRNDYLNMPITDFYKEAYKRGEKLIEIIEKH